MLVLARAAALYWQVNAPVTDFVAARRTPPSRIAPTTRRCSPSCARSASARRRPGADRGGADGRSTGRRATSRPPRCSRAAGSASSTATATRLFYEARPLNPVSYHEWLAEQAVSFVALPDASLDYSAKDEASIVRSFVNGRGAFLHEVWRSRHWRLFAVRGSRRSPSPGVADAASPDRSRCARPSPGTYWVRLRFTPYWAMQQRSGCVEEAPARLDSGARGAARHRSTS